MASRLKFVIFKALARDRGVISRFTDGTGHFTQSWWDAPPTSIDHVGPEYLRQPHRHPNVRNTRHIEFIKRRYKEEIAKFLKNTD
ncbi:MAG: hypothetical protein K0Q73_5381 [Paenibacillus sp.]|jgi:hypothetical protein|nr:hypothetical protein [Paenibacillus sp.]